MLAFRRGLLLVMAGLLATAGTAAASPAQEKPPGAALTLDKRQAGQAAPAIPMIDRTGRTRTLRQLPARVKLVNLWASWCAPCIRELPSLARLQAQYRPADVRVVALSLDQGGWRAAGRAWARVRVPGLDPLLDKTMGWGAAVGARGLPTTILYDARNREIGRLNGPAEWDSPAARAVLDAALAARP